MVASKEVVQVNIPVQRGLVDTRKQQPTKAELQLRLVQRVRDARDVDALPGLLGELTRNRQVSARQTTPRLLPETPVDEATMTLAATILAEGEITATTGYADQVVAMFEQDQQPTLPERIIYESKVRLMARYPDSRRRGSHVARLREAFPDGPPEALVEGFQTVRSALQESALSPEEQRRRRLNGYARGYRATEDPVERSVLLNNLLGELYPMIFNYCRVRLIQSSIRPEDVVQQVLQSVESALPIYKLEAHFDAFVYGIAAHKLLDAKRATARRSRHEDVVPFPPEAVVEESGFEEVDATPNPNRIVKLKAAVATLSPKEQRIILMRTEQNLPFEKIAEAEGIPENSARQVFYRGKHKLRRKLPPDMNPNI